jgi:hypothetical protein
VAVAYVIKLAKFDGEVWGSRPVGFVFHSDDGVPMLRFGTSALLPAAEFDNHRFRYDWPVISASFFIEIAGPALFYEAITALPSTSPSNDP